MQRVIFQLRPAEAVQYAVIGHTFRMPRSTSGSSMNCMPVPSTSQTLACTQTYQAVRRPAAGASLDTTREPQGPAPSYAKSSHGQQGMSSCRRICKSKQALLLRTVIKLCL